MSIDTLILSSFASVSLILLLLILYIICIIINSKYINLVSKLLVSITIIHTALSSILFIALLKIEIYNYYKL